MDRNWCNVLNSGRTIGVASLLDRCGILTWWMWHQLSVCHNYLVDVASIIGVASLPGRCGINYWCGILNWSMWHQLSVWHPYLLNICGTNYRCQSQANLCGINYLCGIPYSWMLHKRLGVLFPVEFATNTLTLMVLYNNLKEVMT